MSSTGARHAILLAMLLLGICSQIVQALLVRESLVVFYGNEVSLGAFFGSWLLWVAIGAWLVTQLRNHPLVHEARRTVASILLSLPLLLALQLVLIRTVRLLFDIPSIELVPLGDLFLSLTLLTLPTSLALGLAFPLACKALQDLETEDGDVGVVRTVSGLFMVEALGALLGGMLFTFVVIRWAGVWRSLGGLTLALAGTAGFLLREPGRPWYRRLTPLLAAAMGLGGLLLATTPLASRLGNALEALRFATLQPGLQLLDALDTRYGHVALARLGTQVSVVRDGHIAESFPRPREMEQTAAYVFAQATGARQLLLFGGLAEGLATELLRYPVERLDVVVEDRQAFERIRPWLPPETRKALEDPRLQLHFEDGRRYLNRLRGGGLDLVLALDAVPTSANGNRYFTHEFYRGVAAHLAPGGVLCTQVSSASNYLGQMVRSYTGSVYRTLEEVLPHIAILPGDTHLYCASQTPGRVSEDPSVLRDRYRAIPLDEHRYPDLSFYSLLDAGDIAYARTQLEAGTGEINSDDRPVTYYLNMLLWGRFSGSGLVERLEKLRRMGIWPYLIPVGTFLLLWLLRHSLEGFLRPRLRRQAATYVLGVVGLVAMAVQLAILFGYQAHVGFMFERVALLNALFMTGLALGTGALGQRLARGDHPDAWLAALLGLLALLLLGLPSLLGHLGQQPLSLQEGAYLGLSTLFGVLTGIGFPLAARQAQRDLGEVTATGGLSVAADSLGGAVGGLLTGALLIPLLGLAGTCGLLALFSLLALLPLLYARWMPTRLPRLQLRGKHAFPWPLAGWGLTFLVLTLFGWQVAEHGTASGPQLRFEKQQLAVVSGSTRFHLDEQDFIFYKGWNRSSTEEAPPTTATLSSMARAAEVRGFAGPLNLLLAVDRQGRLRGVQYVESNETPSYIAGIEGWLRGLAGQDLSSTGLDLQRVDALSGATVSSQAALEAINRSVHAVARVVWGRDYAAVSKGTATGLGSLRFLVTLALLLVAVPLYLWGQERARLLLQVTSLGILGLWLNSLVTEVDLVNLSLGRFPSLAENPQRWLLLGFVLLSGVLLGQMWCGALCPFGALQELVSRLGRRLGLRSYPNRPLETRMRFLKFVLLALMLCVVWLTDEPGWAAFDPMQYAFGEHWEGWMGGLLGVTLAGALFYFRFWCRYFCPFGAFLAMSNKLALLQRLAPRRRFEHCDLGVHEEYDIDCIRCNRCLSGHDTGVRRAGGQSENPL